MLTGIIFKDLFKLTQKRAIKVNRVGANTAHGSLARQLSKHVASTHYIHVVVLLI